MDRNLFSPGNCSDHQIKSLFLLFCILGPECLPNISKKAEKSLAKAKSKYEKAFELFMQSNKEKPNNPDTLNYLGFSSRKLGNFVEAEKYYLSGLSLKPNHNRINQYLGELYLNTNRKDKAIEQLEILKSCNCKEYDQLSNLIEGKTVSKY